MSSKLNDPYRFELYRFKVGAFFSRHRVQYLTLEVLYSARSRRTKEKML